MGKAIGFLFFCFLSTQLWAQSNYELGLLPALNINQKLKKSWGLNYKVESRISGAEGQFSEPSSSKAKYLLTDLSVLTSRKVGTKQYPGGGLPASAGKHYGEPSCYPAIYARFDATMPSGWRNAFQPIRHSRRRKRPNFASATAYRSTYLLTDWWWTTGSFI